MQVSISVDELMKLQQATSEKEAELAMLRRELEWYRAQGQAGGEAPADPKRINLTMDNVCKVLGELKGNPSLVAFLFLSLMKMMPEGVPPQTMQRMMAAASLEGLPLNITTTGDMNVLGTYNNVTGNANVSF